MSDATDLKPTHGELLLIWRRRKRLNQREAARALQVSLDSYREWEGDLRAGQPRKLIRELTAAERCVIARRRSKRTQKEVAASLGVTRVWVNRMERGLEGAEVLRDFWGV